MNDAHPAAIGVRASGTVDAGRQRRRVRPKLERGRLRGQARDPHDGQLRVVDQRGVDLLRHGACAAKRGGGGIVQGQGVCVLCELVFY